MDLREKKADYEAGKALLAARRLGGLLEGPQQLRHKIHAVEMQRDVVRRAVETGMKLGGEEARLAVGYHLYFGFSLQSELDELRAGSFDSPRECSANFYCKVIESLGFESLATYDVGSEKTLIFARPDGAFLIWNTETRGAGMAMRGAAHLAFQWCGYDDADHPDGTSGQFYKAAHRSWVYEGIHDAREGIAATLEKLLENGSFCSPYPVHTDESLQDALISPLDRTQFRERMQRRSDFSEAKMADEMRYIAEKRYKDLPLWAQQMLRPMKFEGYYLEAKGLNLG